MLAKEESIVEETQDTAMEVVPETEGTLSTAAVAPAEQETVVLPPLNGPFAVGDLVEVMERTWSGSNRPGGTARITHANEGRGNALSSGDMVLALMI